MIDLLDPEHKYVSKRVFRESCYETSEKVLIKDLRIFENRNLKNIAIVDNSFYCYGFQPKNGVPILPFYGDKLDEELLELENYFMSIFQTPNLQKEIENYFHSDIFLKYVDNQDELILNLFKKICEN